MITPRAASHQPTGRDERYSTSGSALLSPTEYSIARTNPNRLATTTTVPMLPKTAGTVTPVGSVSAHTTEKTHVTTSWHTAMRFFSQSLTADTPSNSPASGRQCVAGRQHCGR